MGILYEYVCESSQKSIKENSAEIISLKVIQLFKSGFDNKKLKIEVELSTNKDIDEDGLVTYSVNVYNNKNVLLKKFILIEDNEKADIGFEKLNTRRKLYLDMAINFAENIEKGYKCYCQNIEIYKSIVSDIDIFDMYIPPSFDEVIGISRNKRAIE